MFVNTHTSFTSRHVVHVVPYSARILREGHNFHELAFAKIS